MRVRMDFIYTVRRQRWTTFRASTVRSGRAGSSARAAMSPASSDGARPARPRLRSCYGKRRARRRSPATSPLRRDRVSMSRRAGLLIGTHSRLCSLRWARGIEHVLRLSGPVVIFHTSRALLGREEEEMSRRGRWAALYTSPESAFLSTVGHRASRGRFPILIQRRVRPLSRSNPGCITPSKLYTTRLPLFLSSHRPRSNHALLLYAVSAKYRSKPLSQSSFAFSRSVQVT